MYSTFKAVKESLDSWTVLSSGFSELLAAETINRQNSLVSGEHGEFLLIFESSYKTDFIPKKYNKLEVAVGICAGMMKTTDEGISFPDCLVLLRKTEQNETLFPELNHCGENPPV